MNLHQQVHRQLQAHLQQPPSEATLNNALRLLAKYRSTLLQNTLVQLHGTKVQSGPFAGMEFIAQSAEGCHIPKLLGCYEEELHPFIQTLPQAGYDTILNIGCAEGYYAVGLKRLLPQVHMLACDTNPIAQQACITLAQRNGVEIQVSGHFQPQDFANYAGSKTLVWCDIEGAERELLDPVLAPGLEHMDLLVELHPTAQGHTSIDLPLRFSTTHSVEWLQARGHVPVLPPFLEGLGHLDQLLAQWEWRSAPTPWIILRATGAR